VSIHLAAANRWGGASGPHGDVQRHEIERILQIHFFLWDRETLASTDSATLIITTDNRLLHAQHGSVATRRRIFAWAVHVINFLSSPSVKLVYQAPPAPLQKASQRRGKEPLPGHYEIAYRKQLKDDSKDKISPKKFRHRVRYRVRGRFQRFTWGRWRGRVIWTPEPMRG
jgi:hypothetical protein